MLVIGEASCRGWRGVVSWRGERGASALGYVGMFVVAALLISLMVVAATGVGRQLGCMLSNIITGDNAVCATSVAEDLAPDKVVVNKEITTDSATRGLSGKTGVINGSADYKSSDEVGFESHSDGSATLLYIMRKGVELELGPGLGKTKAIEQQLEGNVAAGGGYVSQQVLECKSEDSRCLSDVEEAYKDYKANPDSSKLQEVINRHSDVRQEWRGGRGKVGADIELELKTPEGTSLTKNAEIGKNVEIEVGIPYEAKAVAKAKVDASVSWLREKNSGNFKTMESGMLSAAAEASVKSKIQGKLTHNGKNGRSTSIKTKPKDLPQVFAEASADMGFMVEPVWDKSGKAISLRVVTSRELFTDAGVGDRDTKRKTLVTTATIDLSKIKDAKLRSDLEKMMNVKTSMLIEHPMMMYDVLRHGGIYESLPEGDNPLARALYLHGSAYTQELSTERSSREGNGWNFDWWVVHNQTQIDQQDQVAGSALALSNISNGRRELVPYVPKANHSK
ncbi:hypothetical protein J2S49_000953 [Arcanobacterium wilhelmae]|uniref:Uncharacterized protein n=1 Tax=Arcanobacterium wilhelmae TaxID=1803177 RepID=A0ABT9NAX8_9ACTO|nr:hypothetical protein [Arcanobacterium wilhelmae]MDP9800877.1 hypothetical protein [Arcanobacterium wilhelmae]WFN90244.1 hypothetical protein P8A24_08685 [Arcanobacterium wilhelmae]